MAVCPTGPLGGHGPRFPGISARGAVLFILCRLREPSARRAALARAGLRVRGWSPASVCPAAGGARRAPPSAPAGARPDAGPGALADDSSQLSVFSLVSRAAGK